VKFELTIWRLHVHGYFLWWDADEGEFGGSIWVGLADRKKKRAAFVWGFQGGRG
jgi:hypothetical protein